MGFWQATASGEGVSFFGDISETAVPMLQTAVTRTADALTPFLKEATPVASGRTFDGTPITGGQLRQSLQWQIGTLGAILVGRGYGVFVIGGTAPHEIRPRAAQALAFWSTAEGHGVFRAHVNHPGTAPNDFRQIGLQTAVDASALATTLETVLSDWINGGTA